MRVLIVGCGYVGQKVATELVSEGHEVYGWVASAESAKAVAATGARPLTGDAADGAVWRERKGVRWEAVIFAASTSGGGVETYRRIHEVALSLALEAGAGKPFLYTSSTSVYGQVDGSWVTEEMRAEPATETGKILAAAEKMVLEVGGLVLRLAGIYGPGRAFYLKKLREGTATLPCGGSRWVNQIHRDDAAGAIVWGLRMGRSGDVFNVVDDEPVPLVDLYQWLCAQTGLPLPPEVDEFGPSKRGLTNKRVSNARIVAAGWHPIYPSFREGYRPLLADFEKIC